MFIKNRFALALVACAFFAANRLQAQCPASRQDGLHIVQKGETLYRIALKYKITVADLCAWNGIGAKDRLEVCQTLLTTPPAADPAVPDLYEEDPIPQPAQISAPETPAPRPAKPQKDETPAPQPAKRDAFKKDEIVLSDSVYVDVEYREPQRQEGSYHRVLAGETLEDIADLYGYTDTYFRKMNGLAPDEEVEEGYILRTNNCTCGAMTSDVRFVPDEAELTFKGGKKRQARAVVRKDAPK